MSKKNPVRPCAVCGTALPPRRSRCPGCKPFDLTLFHERLNKAITESELPRKTIAHRSGMTVKHLHGLYSGRDRPTLDRSEALADALNINAVWLVFGKGEQDQRPAVNPFNHNKALTAYLAWNLGYRALRAEIGLTADSISSNALVVHQGDTHHAD